MIFTKSSLTTTVLAVVALMSSFAKADSDMLLISNPTVGTKWKVGEDVFLQWKGSCASMGSSARSVDVNLMTGPESALRFVAKLASIDCSGSNTRKEFVIPASAVAQSGNYSLQVQTNPRMSYSNIFMIDNASGDAPGASAIGNGGSGTNSNQGDSGNSGSMVHISAAAALTPIKNSLGSTSAATAVALAAVLVAAQLL